MLDPITRSLVRVFALAGFIATLFVLAGGGCSSPAPSCDNPCRPGEVVVCSGVCATRNIPPNGLCDPDPCAKSLCSVGHTCFTFGNTSRCAPAAQLTQACGTSSDCDPGLYCLDQPTCGVGSGKDCALPLGPSLTAAQVCDSDFSSPKCKVCDPGTHCIGGADATSSLTPYCRKTCRPNTGSADCPCNTGFQFNCGLDPLVKLPLLVDGQALDPTYCYECRSVGSNNCSSFAPCCDGSQCNNGTCCFADSHQCSATSECCGGEHCYTKKLGTPKTCQACEKAGESCNGAVDCCGGVCLNGTCRANVNDPCKSDDQCPANVACTCGFCSGALKPGQSCSTATGGECLCELGNPETSCSHGGGNSSGNACCFSKECHICKQDVDCCGHLHVCELINKGGVCCGGTGATCGTDDECCSHLACVKGFCTAGPNRTVCANGPIGCTANIGDTCGGNVTCCSPNECVNGLCAAPTAYHLLGYRFGKQQITPGAIYDYQLTATPADFDVVEAAFVALQPNSLVAVDPLNVNAATPKPFGQVPITLSAFTLTGSVPSKTVADILVGEGSQATLYERYDFVAPSFAKSHVATGLTGSTIAISASPLFDQVSLHTAAILTNAPWLYFVDFAPSNVSLAHQTTLSGLGTAVDVSAGDTEVFVATANPNQVRRFAAPNLPLLQSSLPLSDPPIAIAGSEADSYVVVANAGPALLGFPPFSLTDPPKKQSLNGTPVDLVVYSAGIFEFVWVATASPNEILQFSVSGNGFNQIAQLSLTATPVKLRVDAPNGIIHVLVKP